MIVIQCTNGDIPVCSSISPVFEAAIDDPLAKPKFSIPFTKEEFFGALYGCAKPTKNMIECAAMLQFVSLPQLLRDCTEVLPEPYETQHRTMKMSIEQLMTQENKEYLELWLALNKLIPYKMALHCAQLGMDYVFDPDNNYEIHGLRMSAAKWYNNAKALKHI